MTFAILTDLPNDDIEHIHDCQPQALTLAGVKEWLALHKSVDELQAV